MSKGSDITFKIHEHLGTIKDAKWPVEVNIVSWNNKAPQIDIRAWAPDRSRAGKGISLDRDAAVQLWMLLDEYLGTFEEEGKEVAECID